jgi:hypothetical protein
VIATLLFAVGYTHKKKKKSNTMCLKKKRSLQLHALAHHVNEILLISKEEQTSKIISVG